MLTQWVNACLGVLLKRCILFIPDICAMSVYIQLPHTVMRTVSYSVLRMADQRPIEIVKPFLFQECLQLEVVY
jgi:hypothetical protein